MAALPVLSAPDLAALEILSPGKNARVSLPLFLLTWENQFPFKGMRVEGKRKLTGRFFAIIQMTVWRGREEKRRRLLGRTDGEKVAEEMVSLSPTPQTKRS